MRPNTDALVRVAAMALLALSVGCSNPPASAADSGSCAGGKCDDLGTDTDTDTDGESGSADGDPESRDTDPHSACEGSSSSGGGGISAAAAARLRAALQRLCGVGSQGLRGPGGKQPLWLYINHLGWCR